MSEYYKFVADENELKWFFDHVIEKPELDESYMLCLSARNKKLDPDERLIYQLGRGEMMREAMVYNEEAIKFSSNEVQALTDTNIVGAFKNLLKLRKLKKEEYRNYLMNDDINEAISQEVIAPRSKSKLWDFNIFRSAVYRYECRKEGMVTKNGKDYPDKCLVVYFYPNPSKESLVVSDSVQLSVKMMAEMINAAVKRSWEGVTDGIDKLGTISKHLKSSHATNLNRKIYIQFDFDLMDEDKKNETAIKEILDVLHKEGLKHFGKGQFAIVRTSGGYHVLVKRNALSKDMEKVNNRRKAEKLSYMPDYLYDVTNTCKYKFEEAIKCKQEFIPLPGTYQYGKFVVTVENKEDFN